MEWQTIVGKIGTRRRSTESVWHAGGARFARTTKWSIYEYHITLMTYGNPGNTGEEKVTC